MAKANDTIHNPFHGLTTRKANRGQNPPLDTTNDREALIEAIRHVKTLVDLIFQGLFVLTQTPVKSHLEKEV